jgi:hypothetical protein
MTRMMIFAAVAAAAALVAACGSSPNTPADGARPDAGRPDGPPTVPPDGPPPIDAPPIDTPPDAPPPIDLDHDGHPADADCDDNDPAVWQDLAYSFRDVDGDLHTVAASGTICTGDRLPPGYATEPGAPDCDDADPAIFTSVVGFFDGDDDHVGDGPAMAFCTAGSLPAHYAETDGDCAPADATRFTDRPYSFRDADGDGAAIAETGTVCSGTVLPAGYLATAPDDRPLDCDDTNPAVSVALTIFTDADGDHVGAGPAQLACTSGTVPAGFSLTGTDCDDANSTLFLSLAYTAADFDGDSFTVPAMGTQCTAGTLLPPFVAVPHGNDCNDSNAAVWAELTYRAVDRDHDGFTVPETGMQCTNGTLPPPFFDTAHGNDCNDDDPALFRFAVLYHDGDGDGVGAPPRNILCLGPADPGGFVPGGYDEDDNDPAVIETEDFDDLLDLIVLGG